MNVLFLKQKRINHYSEKGNYSKEFFENNSLILVEHSVFGQVFHEMEIQNIDEEGNEVFDHIATTDIEGMYSFELERMNDLKIALMINKK